ncbi:MAG: GNAT family N-acetyltransferase [Gemmatimonadota bacterium]
MSEPGTRWITASERLQLRAFTLADAAWVLPMLNDAAFLEHVGDKGVRSIADAERYLTDGPLASYLAHGFGLSAVVRASDGEPVGMAGVITRPTLPAPDIGYAMRPTMRGSGYGFEAAAMALAYGHRDLGFPQLLAIVNPGNTASRQILARLGFRHESMHRPPDGTKEVELHVHDA